MEPRIKFEDRDLKVINRINAEFEIGSDLATITGAMTIEISCTTDMLLLKIVFPDSESLNVSFERPRFAKALGVEADVQQ